MSLLIDSHLRFFQGRKPWTQITVTLPIKSGTSDEDDLAVVWAVMKKCSNDKAKENSQGDIVWSMWGDQYLEWLNIDRDKTKPVNKFVHPVLFETGARRQALLKNKITKARESGRLVELERLERQLEDHEQAQQGKESTEPSGKDYHWSTYEECVVTFKKNQRKKIAKELHLTVKVRTRYLGCGDPKDNNGYLGSCECKTHLNPESKLFRLLSVLGM